ncbi:MAG: hypothetical protein H6557_31385 [Lewinellaceae bacterium]|nr:hypothetical protein [Phaeodactylibacter sp.]MCB9041151.1 hypothetical protein [Lewinellaceae bacterium]
MEKKQPTTIKGHALYYAQCIGIQFSEEEYQRYYKRYLRQNGGWGNKFYMAASIVDAIQLNERKLRRK